MGTNCFYKFEVFFGVLYRVSLKSGVHSFGPYLLCTWEHRKNVTAKDMKDIGKTNVPSISSKYIYFSVPCFSAVDIPSALICTFFISLNNP
jgi:hypothetical protein